MNYADISDLPPRYQEQVRRKLQEKTSKASQGKEKQHAPRPEKSEEPKYHNRRTLVDGISFDSKKEARRYVELRDMLRCKAISDLKLQQEFTLQEAYTTPEGVRVRAIRYKADFTYYRDDGAGHDTLVVEDVKSRATKTRVYEIKRKLLREKFGIEINEV